VRGAGQPQQLVEPLRRRGILLDGFRPPAEGGDLIDQLVLGDLRQATQQRLPLAEVGDPAQLNLVDLVQLLPLLASAVERLQHLGDLDLHRAAHEHPLERRARLGVRRLGDQNLAVGLDRLRQVHQRQLVDLRQSEGQRDPLVVRGRDADLPADDCRQLLPLLRAAVQTIERDEGRSALAVRLHRLAVGGDGLLGLVGLLFVDAPEAQQEIDLLVRIVDLLQLGGEQGPELAPVPRFGRQPIELEQHVLVGRIDTEGATVDIERRVLVREAPLLDLRHATEQLHLVGGLLRLRLHHLVDGDDPVPLAGALVDRLQHLRRQHRRLGLAARHERFQRADGRLVPGVHGQHLAVGLHGARQILEVLAPQLADAEAE